MGFIDLLVAEELRYWLKASWELCPIALLTFEVI
jgi:hypothetical protein